MVTAIRYSVLFLGVSFIPAFSAMIYVAPVDLTGTGLGNVATILTMQEKGSESGCVGFGSSGDLLGSSACAGGNTGGDEKKGASQTLTRSFAEIGVSSASELVVIFNPSQPGGGPITLDNLILSIFSPTGSLLFSSSTFTPVSFDETDNGTGKSGFAFRLSQSDAIQAAPFVAANNRIGLSATANSTHGGLETFFVANIDNFPGLEVNVSEIPEPATFLLLGVGLILAAVLHRRFA